MKKLSEVLYNHAHANKRPAQAAFCALVLCVTSATYADDSVITSPPPPPVPSVAWVLKPGAPLNFTGSANGTNFQRYRLQWARGLNPVSGWSNLGITLASGGTTPITNGLLGAWNSGTVTQADFYSIRLLVDQGAITNQGTTTVYLEPDLYSTNWPHWLDQAPGDNSALPVRDALGRTRLALVNPPWASTTLPSRLWVFDLDGSSFTTNTLDHGGYMQPAMAELDGAPGDELIVAEWNKLRVFRPDGSSYNLTPSLPSNFQDTLITLADLDGDGHPEIITLGSNLGNSDGWLYAWSTNGQMFTTNYPVYVPDGNFDLRSLDRIRVAPVDIDADGKPELLVVAGDTGSSFSLRMLRGDGSPANWPTQTLSGTFRYLAVGDLDHDGSPEIVLAYSDASSANWVQVYSSAGIPRAGWPRQLGGGTPLRVVLGDLNRDGTNEIIATEYADMYVFRPDGTQFPGAWPHYGGSFEPYSIPIVADIDGDGSPEIVVPHGNLFFANGQYYSETSLVAYRTNGAIARSWLLLGANGNQPSGEGTPIIGDFDGDGKLELAINYRVVSGGGSSGYLHEGVLTVLRLPGLSHPNPRDWPMNFHDVRNTSTTLTAARLRQSKSGSNLVLSWPLQPESAVLQSADDPRGPWGAETTPIVLSNALNTVTIPPTNAHKWFRLRYP